MQVGLKLFKKDASVQAGTNFGSYNHNQKTIGSKKLCYDELLVNYLSDHRQTIIWLQEYGLISKERTCDICDFPMKLVEMNDRADGFKWECQHTVNGKRHQTECSLHKDSFLVNQIQQLKKF